MLWVSELSHTGIGLQRMLFLQKTGVKHTIICVLAQSNYMDTTIGIFDSIYDILDGFLQLLYRQWNLSLAVLQNVYKLL